jgi:DNA repair protein RadC
MNIALADDQKIKMMNSSMVYKVMQQILLRENEVERDQEHFYVVCLAANNRLLNVELIGLGAIDESIIKPMQVFRIAILKGAVKIILVHNHPSLELRPSEADKALTDRMIQVGLIVNVKVVDHLIITPKFFYSFDENGLMKELSESKKWIPAYVEEERVRKEALKIGKETGLKEGKKEGAEKERIKMARKSLKEGLPIKLISKLTGLSNEEIEKLVGTAH